MNSKPTYRITDWAEHFETAEARKTKCLRWVALPTKHDGLTYRRLMREDPMIYLGWVLMLAVAAKSRQRGVLADENGPYDTVALSLKTDCPKEIFDKAIPPLVKCGWLTAEEIPEALGEHPDVIRMVSGRHPETSGDHPPTLHTDIHTEHPDVHPDAACAACVVSQSVPATAGTTAKKRKSQPTPDLLGPDSEQTPSPPVSAKDFQAAWDALGLPFAKIRSWTRTRAKTFKARLADPFFRENWRQALDKVKASPFCKGQSKSRWVASIDFFLRPDSVAKIVEGKYDSRDADATPSPEALAASLDAASPEDHEAIEKAYSKRAKQ